MPCTLLTDVVNACAIVLPLPAVAPLTPLALTVQLKVVPLTVFGLLNAMLVVLPLQIVCTAGVANTSGIGLTFTVTVCTGLL